MKCLSRQCSRQSTLPWPAWKGLSTKGKIKYALFQLVTLLPLTLTTKKRVVRHPESSGMTHVTPHHPASPQITLSRNASPCITLPLHASPCLTMPHPTSACLPLPPPASPCITLHHPAWPQITHASPYITLPLHASPCLSMHHPVILLTSNPPGLTVSASRSATKRSSVSPGVAKCVRVFAHSQTKHTWNTFTFPSLLL